MKKLVLIDGHALVHRAFHALPPTMASAKGVLTNAVFGFTSVLIKMIKDLNPEYIVATFDLPGPTIRHEEFAEYKIHRQKAPDELYAQLPLVQEILTAFGIPIFTKPGYEADDIIGSLTEKAKKNKDLQVVIVTGDLDTLQLVDGDKVVVFTLKKGLTDTVIYDEKEVFKRYNLAPNQVVDFKGLKGDPSDNIPGVPGIGDKTASALIGEFSSIEKLYETLEKKGGNKGNLSEKMVEKLNENKEMAFFSKKLATIIKDLDINFELPKAKWLDYLDKDKLSKVLQDLGFYSLIKRLEEIKTMSTQQSLLGAKPEVPIKLEFSTNYTELSNKKDIEEVLETIEAKKDLIFHVNNGIIYLINNGKSVVSIDLRLVTDELKQKLYKILENKNIRKSGHDLKELAKSIFRFGTRLGGSYFDTKLASYLLNSDVREYELGKIYFNEFNQNLDPATVELKPSLYPLAVIKLREKLWDRMKEEKLLKVFEDIEIPLSIVLAEMELAGVKVDTKSLGEMLKMLNKETEKLEKQIYDACGRQFNINSPQQLSQIIFERLGLKGKIKKTGKGALSTAASELEKLTEEHPVIALILKYRELQKLKTTYVESFPNYVNKETSRIHTTFNQIGAATGRLSSQEPNIQNIPIRTELGQEFRKIFVAEKGFSLVSFDYSQLELRIAAHIAKDEKMTEAFKRGEDIHTRTAAEIYNVEPGSVTKEMRRQAKVMNFGLLYGMGILGFQKASGVSRETAKEFIQKYIKEFSGIAEYMQKMRTDAKKNGYVETVFGRKRKLPEISSGIPMLVAQAERMAINMPIQGTAADLIKMAMVKIEDLINKKYPDDEVRMLLQVHDELLFEIKEGKEKEIAKNIKEIMENGYQFDVPIVVDVRWGENWKEMKSLNI